MARIAALRNQRGSLLIETLCACIIFTIIFAGLSEAVLLLKDRISIVRVAREGAREAALTGETSDGRSKAIEVASLYFKEPVQVEVVIITEGKTESVLCNAAVTHYPFFNIIRKGGVVLNEQAVYHFKDHKKIKG